MKTEILTERKVQEIDWSKPQWVINADFNVIVLTDGRHTENYFAGTCLPCQMYRDGIYRGLWEKSYFTSITELTIRISND